MQDRQSAAELVVSLLQAKTLMKSSLQDAGRFSEESSSWQKVWVDGRRSKGGAGRGREGSHGGGGHHSHDDRDDDGGGGRAPARGGGGGGPQRAGVRGGPAPGGARGGPRGVGGGRGALAAAPRPGQRLGRACPPELAEPVGVPDASGSPTTSATRRANPGGPLRPLTPEADRSRGADGRRGPGGAPPGRPGRENHPARQVGHLPVLQGGRGRPDHVPARPAALPAAGVARRGGPRDEPHRARRRPPGVRRGGGR